MRTLYLHLYSVRYGQPKRCAYCTYARVLGRAHYNCTCTVFGMGSLNGEPIVRKSVCLGVHTVCVRTVFGVGGLGDAPIVHKPVYLVVHTVCVRVQCLAWTA